MNKDEKAFWEARRELRLVRDWARSWRATPWSTLGVTLARVVAATGHELELPREGSLNLFVGLVGRSGAGKGVSTKTSHQAVKMLDAKTVSIGSGEGIAHQFAYYEKGNKAEGITPGVKRIADQLLIDVPEIDTLAAIGGRSGSTILPELRKAWSGEPLGMAYANREKALHIEARSYRISLVAGIQPARADVLLGDSDGGTPQRFVWLPVTDPDAPQVAPEAPPSMEWRFPVRRGARQIGGNYEMQVCRRAKQEVDAFNLAGLLGDREGLEGHEMYARLKVAAALGLFNGHVGINDEDWDLSLVLMNRSLETRQSVEEAALTARAEVAKERGRLSHVSKEAFEDEERKIMRACDNALTWLKKERKGMSHSSLRRCIRSDIREYFDKAIERLLDKNLIVRDQDDYGVHYRAKR